MGVRSAELRDDKKVVSTAASWVESKVSMKVVEMVYKKAESTDVKKVVKRVVAMAEKRADKTVVMKGA